MTPEQQETLSAIYKYCAYQDRCTSEVTQKLRDLGLPDIDIPDMLAHLEVERFLDDERFARSFVRGKFNHKKWGKNKIRFEIRKKGISDILVRRIIKEEIEEEDYRKMLEKLIERKRKELNGQDEFRQKEKIVRFLTQKGYEMGIIWEELGNK